MDKDRIKELAGVLHDAVADAERASVDAERVAIRLREALASARVALAGIDEQLAIRRKRARAIPGSRQAVAIWAVYVVGGQFGGENKASATAIQAALNVKIRSRENPDLKPSELMQTIRDDCADYIAGDVAEGFVLTAKGEQARPLSAPSVELLPA